MERPRQSAGTMRLLLCVLDEALNLSLEQLTPSSPARRFFLWPSEPPNNLVRNDRTPENTSRRDKKPMSHRVWMMSLRRRLVCRSSVPIEASHSAGSAASRSAAQVDSALAENGRRLDTLAP